MTLADVLELFAYHRWANERLCTMLSTVFGEESSLNDSPSAVVAALHETAIHIAGAEQIWRLRIEGTSPDSLLDAADYSTVADVRRLFAAEHARTQALLESLQSDTDLDRIITSKSTKGEPRVFPLRVLLQHIVNHSSYHRGQITARLIDLGLGKHIIPTDFTAFMMEHAVK